jgi:5-methylcytosine-specific restriction protein B
MKINEAARRLAEMYQKGAAQKEQVTHIHLFAITYADEITGMSLPEILAQAGLPASYKTELRKGINLAKYVRPKN